MNAVPLTAPRLAAAALLLCALGAAAQDGAPPPEAAAPASAPAGPDPKACARFTDQASAADVQATGLRSQRGDLTQLAGLLDRAVDLWTQAVAACEGRPRERARRNLADTRQLRDEVAEQLGSGEACDTTQRHAASYQDLARAAMGERRFTEAARLFRKAEDQWDLAHERCTGKARDDAVTRRDQSEVDGHNAEHCAPLFDQARESTQRLRNGGAALSPTDRQRASLGAETLWRDAVAQCKGSAQDLARQNADTLARERGTPWVATRPTGESAPTLPVTPTAHPAAPPAATATAASLSSATPTPAPTSPRPSAAPPPSPAQPSAPGPAPASPAVAQTPDRPDTASVAELDAHSGDTRYKGRFVREPGQVLSGHGRVEWSNGDAYEGQLVRSKRHGQGEFIWASGQRYKGDWVEDEPTGRGLMLFPNGNRWEGQVLRGEPHGEGRMAYASGDIYVGQMQAGQAHGQGLYTWANGQRLEAQWQTGQAQGQGKLRFANGNDYQGELRDGIPHGQGRLVYASGDIYQGGFVQGLAHGLGRYQWRHGDHYEGAWQQGKKEGQGVFHWANGDRWEGLFKNDEADEDAGKLIKAGQAESGTPK